jgi:hypothetical protein
VLAVLTPPTLDKHHLWGAHGMTEMKETPLQMLILMRRACQ